MHPPVCVKIARAKEAENLNVRMGIKMKDSVPGQVKLSEKENIRQGNQDVGGSLQR